MSEHLAPLGEAVGADRGVDQHAERREKLAELDQSASRVGKPVQRHACGDEVEGAFDSRSRSIHDLEADAVLTSVRQIAPALLDHGWRKVGEEERSVGVAREQMPAEQPSAAAEFEHTWCGGRR